jgi:hypothetical protein
MDAEGTRTLLPQYLKVVELRALTRDRTRSSAWLPTHSLGDFPTTTLRPGVNYMLSSENLVAVDPAKGIVTYFPPHVMFYGRRRNRKKMAAE